MKNHLKFGLLSSLFLSNFAHALNPVEGLYLGFIAGVNYSPNVNVGYPFTNNIFIPYGTRGTLSYDIGGNFGGQLGYRICNYRIEAEFDYASLGYDRMEFNGIVIKNKRRKNEIKLGGKTTIMTGFLNGYYDFFSPDSETSFVPYIGLGIGMAQFRNTVDFTFNGQLIVKATNSRSTGALQGILGFSYYLDDYSKLTLDYRYFTSNAEDAGGIFKQRFNMSSVNFGLNFALAS